MNFDITNISLGPKYADKIGMLTGLMHFDEQKIWDKIPPELRASPLLSSLGELDTKVKNSAGLSFEEAFSGMLYVVCATNNFVRLIVAPNLPYDEAVAKGSYFLTLMAAKENFLGLTSDEVAGMVAAGSVDVAYSPPLAYAFETAGMGADRGWENKTVKTINASTLTSIVLASMGYKSTKHGSYGNTTKVGSTDVPEKFGANILQTSPEEVQNLLDVVNFWFSDAHCVKTLHYLSHLLMVETINHVVGPMTPPISPMTRLYKLMGVNHNVHPEVIAKAYVKLHKMGFVNLGGAVIIGGVDEIPSAKRASDPDWFRQHCYLDELSPTATIVSLASENEFIGNVVLNNCELFGVTIHNNQIMVNNEIDTLLKAAEEALTGGVLAEYLACNVALALLAYNLHEVSDFDLGLKDHFNDVMSVIENGAAMQTLNKYIEVSGGKRVYWS